MKLETMRETLAALTQGFQITDDTGAIYELKDDEIKAQEVYNGKWYKMDYDDIVLPATAVGWQVTVDVWLNVYHCGITGASHASKELADGTDADVTKDRIACINVRRAILKGEGL